MKNLNLWQVGPGGIVLEIDTSDPDTPALVWDSTRRKHSATYDCAIDTEELDCGDGPQLTQDQIRWLETFQDRVSDAYNQARNGLPQYE